VSPFAQAAPALTTAAAAPRVRAPRSWTLPRWLLAAGLLVGWSVSGAIAVRRLAHESLEDQGALRHRRAHSDFDGFWRAGRDVLAGRDIYVLPGAEDAPWSTSPVKRYLPVFAVAMVPFALLPLVGAGLVLHVVAGVSLWGSARCASRLAGRDPDGDAWPVLLGVAATAAFWTGHLALGQVGLPVLWLTLAGVEQAARGKALRGGALLGLAAALKLTPALLAVWLLLRGRRAAAVIAGATFVALCGATAVAFGPARALDLHARWLREHGSTAGAAYSEEGKSLRFTNASLASTLGRLLLDENAGYNSEPFQVNVADVGPAAATRLLQGCEALALAGLLALALRRRRLGDATLSLVPGSGVTPCAEVGLALGLVAVFTPIAWTHHFVVLLPGAVALAASPDRTSRGWLAASVLLQLTLISPLTRACGGLLLSDLAVVAGCGALVWRSPEGDPQATSVLVG
jgi:alpha-1,2-mannosyltransferase